MVLLIIQKVNYSLNVLNLLLLRYLVPLFSAQILRYKHYSVLPGSNYYGPSLLQDL